MTRAAAGGPATRRRPRPRRPIRLYRYFVERVAASGLEVGEGVFRAMMDVSLVNQGPVTLLLDSTRAF